MINIYVCFLEIITLDIMGCCFSLNEPKTKILDQTPLGDDYLRPEWTITFSIDRTYEIPLTDIQLDGWFESSVRL